MASDFMSLLRNFCWLSGGGFRDFYNYAFSCQLSGGIFMILLVESNKNRWSVILPVTSIAILEFILLFTRRQSPKLPRSDFSFFLAKKWRSFTALLEWCDSGFASSWKTLLYVFITLSSSFVALTLLLLAAAYFFLLKMQFRRK